MNVFYSKTQEIRQNVQAFIQELNQIPNEVIKRDSCIILIYPFKMSNFTVRVYVI